MCYSLLFLLFPLTEYQHLYNIESTHWDKFFWSPSFQYNFAIFFIRIGFTSSKRYFMDFVVIANIVIVILLSDWLCLLCYIFSHFAELLLVVLGFRLILLDLLDTEHSLKQFCWCFRLFRYYMSCFSGLIMLVGTSRALLNGKHPVLFQFEKVSISV